MEFFTPNDEWDLDFKYKLASLIVELSTKIESQNIQL